LKKRMNVCKKMMRIKSQAIVNQNRRGSHHLKVKRRRINPK